MILQNILSLVLILLTSQIPVMCQPNQDESRIGYINNLKIASELFLAKSDIPETVLLGLVPYSHDEFELYYATTYPDNKLQDSQFFYISTKMIFKKVTIEKNENFYLPSLQLASFADGEYGEEFIEFLEEIINIDNKKFCVSVKGKEYAKHNPIKYYYDELKCK
jgi:hypothetical protein